MGLMMMVAMPAAQVTALVQPYIRCTSQKLESCSGTMMQDHLSPPPPTPCYFNQLQSGQCLIQSACAICILCMTKVRLLKFNRAQGIPSLQCAAAHKLLMFWTTHRSCTFPSQSSGEELSSGRLIESITS
jgi:hypothetical protein